MFFQGITSVTQLILLTIVYTTITPTYKPIVTSGSSMCEYSNEFTKGAISAHKK